MDPKEHILLAAVRLHRFTVSELVAASGQTRSAVESWLRRSREKKSILQMDTMPTSAPGAPKKIFELAEQARADAYQNAQVYRELAREQYMKGVDRGLVPRPSFSVEELLGPAEQALTAALDAFRQFTVREGIQALLDRETRAGVFQTWQRSCANPERDEFADVHALRKLASDRLRYVDALVADWEDVGVSPDPILARRFKAVRAVTQDPRAFLVAAGLQEIVLHSEARGSVAGTSYSPVPIRNIAYLLAEEARAEADAVVVHTKARDAFDVSDVRRAPALRLFYAIDWFCRYRDAKIPDKQTSPQELWPVFVGTICAQATKLVRRIRDAETDENRAAYLGRCILSEVAYWSGWLNIAQSISSLGRLFMIRGSDQNLRDLLWLASRLAFALYGEMSEPNADARFTQPKGNELNALEGAMFALVGTPAWPAYADPLIALSFLYKLEQREYVGDLFYLERFIGSSQKLGELAAMAGLSDSMQTDLVHLSQRVNSSKWRGQKAQSAQEITAQVEEIFAARGVSPAQFAAMRTEGNG